MFYVYIIKSEKDESLYIGYTEDLQRRFQEHNSGLVGSTKLKTPFELIYYEAYLAKSDAKHRENMIKRFSGAYNHLKKRIKNSIILSK